MDYAVELYSYVQRKRANLLTKIEDPADLQVVGKAFCHFALLIDNGDKDINSVAAENGYYCLAKSIIIGNYYAAQTLYELLCTSPDLLLDKFMLSNLSDDDPIRDNPFDLMYGYLLDKSARNEAFNNIFQVRYFLISKFYDMELNKSLIPDDIIEYSKANITSDIKKIKEKSSINETLQIGNKYFFKVYNLMEKTLVNF